MGFCSGGCGVGEEFGRGEVLGPFDAGDVVGGVPGGGAPGGAAFTTVVSVSALSAVLVSVCAALAVTVLCSASASGQGGVRFVGSVSAGFDSFQSASLAAFEFLLDACFGDCCGGHLSAPKLSFVCLTENNHTAFGGTVNR